MPNVFVTRPDDDAVLSDQPIGQGTSSPTGSTTAQPGGLSDADMGLTPALGGSAPAGQNLSDEEVGLSAPDSTKADVAKGALSGIGEGVAQLAGLPGDIQHAVDYGTLWAETHLADAFGQLPKGQTPDSLIQQYRGSAMRAMLESAGAPAPTVDAAAQYALPTSQETGAAIEHYWPPFSPNYAPQTQPGQYAKSIASFVPSAALAPEESLAGVGKNLLAQAVLPGAGSEFAGRAVKGTVLEPYARALGALAPGTAASIGAKVAGEGLNAGRGFLDYLTPEGQQNVAARTLAGAASNPQAVQQELAAATALRAPGAGMGEIVPGSLPQTGQLSGDLGLINATREAVTENPALYQENQFGTGMAQQNAARVAALNSVQPLGSPAAVADTVRQSLADIDAQHTAAVQTALAQAKAQGMSIGAGKTPAEVGEAIRAPLVAARAAAKAKENSLWDALGDFSMRGAAIKGRATSVTSSLPSTAKPMSAEEKAIFDTARQMPNNARFSDIYALASRTGEEMRAQIAANGGVPNASARRLTLLKQTIDNVIATPLDGLRRLRRLAFRPRAAIYASELPDGEQSSALERLVRAPMKPVLVQSQETPQSGLANWEHQDAIVGLNEMLAETPGPERPELLDYLEKRAIKEKDFAALKVIREVRRTFRLSTPEPPKG
jgi:hypothetical protein